MTPVSPGFLFAGLVSVLIPVLIFLLWRFRKQPVPWAAMRFILMAWKRHRRRLRMENYLLLALRCLLLLILGAALSRPFLDPSGVAPRPHAREVWLIMDNGITTAVTSGVDGYELEELKASAGKLLDALDQADQVSIISTTGASPSDLVPSTTNHDRARMALASMQPSPVTTSIDDALGRVVNMIAAGEDDTTQNLVYLFSPFREGSARLDIPLTTRAAPAQGRVVFHASSPFTGSRTNRRILAIDASHGVLLPGTPGSGGFLSIHLSRAGKDLPTAEETIRIRGPGIDTVRIHHWAAGQTDAKIHVSPDTTVKPARHSVVTARIENDQLLLDNTCTRILGVRDSIHISILGRRRFLDPASSIDLEAADWLKLALDPAQDGTASISFSEIEPVTLEEGQLAGTDMLVVSRPDLLEERQWGMLSRYVHRGGVMLVMPPGDSGVHAWADDFCTGLKLDWTIGREAVEYPAGLMLAEQQPHSFLLGSIQGEMASLVRPVMTTKALPVQGDEGAEVLLRFEDGSPMVLAASRGSGGGTSGLVVLFAVSPHPSWTSLPGKPLMVPLVQEILRHGISRARDSITVQAGSRPMFGDFPSAQYLLHEESSRRIAIDPMGMPDEPLIATGPWRILDAAEREVGKMAVNTNPAGGLIDEQDPLRVEAWLDRSADWNLFHVGDPATTLATTGHASSLAFPLLLLLVAVVVLETILARRFTRQAGTSLPGTREGLGLQTTRAESIRTTVTPGAVP